MSHTVEYISISFDTSTHININTYGT